MDVKFLSTSQTQSTLIALVENCESMQWAVAWATENAVFEAAMKDSSKFEHFVVGTHMFQTQPEVLERAAALAAAAVVPPTGDLFHPKVYLFRNGQRIRCVVGSPNLTKAAMSRNVEASVLLDGSLDDAALVELSRFVAEAWKGAEDLCENFGVSPSTTNLENYWRRIIEPMHGDPWWRHPQPSNAADAEIWLGRAALLDAIYYTPR